MEYSKTPNTEYITSSRLSPWWDDYTKVKNRTSKGEHDVLVCDIVEQPYGKNPVIYEDTQELVVAVGRAPRAQLTLEPA